MMEISNTSSYCSLFTKGESLGSWTPRESLMFWETGCHIEAMRLCVCFASHRHTLVQATSASTSDVVQQDYPIANCNHHKSICAKDSNHFMWLMGFYFRKALILSSGQELFSAALVLGCLQHNIWLDLAHACGDEQCKPELESGDNQGSYMHQAWS